MKRFSKVLMVAVLCLGMGRALSISAAYAEDVPDYRLRISPAKERIEELKPGEAYEGSFTVKNTGGKSFNFEAVSAPYSVKDDRYSADFSTESVYTELMDWITLDIDSGVLEPDEEKKITYTINVPDDTHGGFQSAAIITQIVESGDIGANAIQATNQVAYLIYANIDGDLVETGGVLENRVPSFLFNPPIKAISVVENTGNVYARATYKLQVFPLFSDEEVYTNEETPEDSVVFPETKRYNEITWDGAPQLGLFKVRQTVKIFDDESVTEKLVFLCPIWFLFIVILLVFLIIFWIVSRALKRKREA